MNKRQWYKPPLKCCRSSVGKQQVVLDAAAQADKNDHKEKEYKDSKKKTTRQHLQCFAGASTKNTGQAGRWPGILVLITSMITS